ncbi:MAG: putative transposase, partial [Halobacteriales archaeon]
MHSGDIAGFHTIKAEAHGILVDRVDEANTSKTCSCCGQIRDTNRVERG